VREGLVEVGGLNSERRLTHPDRRLGPLDRRDDRDELAVLLAQILVGGFHRSLLGPRRRVCRARVEGTAGPNPPHRSLDPPGRGPCARRDRQGSGARRETTPGQVADALALADQVDAHQRVEPVENPAEGLLLRNGDRRVGELPAERVQLLEEPGDLQALASERVGRRSAILQTPGHLREWKLVLGHDMWDHVPRQPLVHLADALSELPERDEADGVGDAPDLIGALREVAMLLVERLGWGPDNAHAIRSFGPHTLAQPLDACAGPGDPQVSGPPPAAGDPGLALGAWGGGPVGRPRPAGASARLSRPGSSVWPGRGSTPRSGSPARPPGRWRRPA